MKHIAQGRWNLSTSGKQDQKWGVKNKNIKDSHTFRRRLSLGDLFDVLLRMVKEWSEEDDSLLISSRLATLHGQRDSLKLR